MALIVGLLTLSTVALAERDLPFPAEVNSQWVYQVVAVGVEGTLTRTVSEARRVEGGWEVALTTRVRLGTVQEERLLAVERYLVSGESVLKLTGFGGGLEPPLPLWTKEGPPEREWRGRVVSSGEEWALTASVHRDGTERVVVQGKTQVAEKIRVVWSGVPFASEQVYWFVSGVGFVKFQVDTSGGRVTGVLQEFRPPRAGPGDS
ncbi:MAG: hypothetical protein K6T17_01645 [Fimbriimonadales bacterium]|nr:hypothetical protein [Fimbriimonadales bacterium]